MEDWVGTPRTEVQGTDEWKRARAKRLGGSEIASVLRLSPYKTRLQLWEEKTGRRKQEDISKLSHVKRGIDAEPIARRYLEDIMGVKYTTPVLHHRGYQWMTASLDGLATDHILEIKTMSKAKHDETALGIVPEYYECQVIWNMGIAGKLKGLFASYRPEEQDRMKKLYWKWIEFDLVKFGKYMNEAIKFWECVEQDKRPDDDLELSL